MLIFRVDHGADPDPAPIYLLSTKQRAIIEVLDAFERANGESCSVALLARRLRVHHSTIQEHLSALHRKGWLVSPNAPLFLRRKP